MPVEPTPHPQLEKAMRAHYKKTDFTGTGHTSLKNLQAAAAKRIEEENQGKGKTPDTIARLKKDECDEVAKQYSATNVARIAHDRKAGFVHRNALKLMVKTETTLRKLGMEKLADYPCAVLAAAFVVVNIVANMIYQRMQKQGT